MPALILIGFWIPVKACSSRHYLPLTGFITLHQEYEQNLLLCRKNNTAADLFHPLFSQKQSGMCVLSCWSKYWVREQRRVQFFLFIPDIKKPFTIV
jgi:hypothetical protein